MPHPTGPARAGRAAARGEAERPRDVPGALTGRDAGAADAAAARDTSRPEASGPFSGKPVPALPAGTSGKGRRPGGRTGSHARLRLVVVLALLVLLTRLAVSGFYYVKRWEPQAPSFPKAGTAEASPVAAVPAGGAALAGAASLPATGSMVAGASMLFTEAADPTLALAAQLIPLPPGEESLRQPQPPLPSPSPQAAPAQGPPAQIPPPQAAPAQGPPVALAPPPAATSPGGATAEELARREFDVQRREQLLNTREEAIRQLETDVNQRMRDAEATEGRVTELVAKNDAILAEQKAAREEQVKRDEALKSERVEHLVTAFKGMKPEQAGNLINSMDDSVAVAILSAMPGSNAGKILAMVAPEKAARLVKAISEQRVDPRVLLESSQVPVQ
ncbi:MAG: hypothetical protein LBG06_00705 [Deltaproteobacteria bacterium]|nr:hypothetical protein [Deltaproteobacteria bacterium]